MINAVHDELVKFIIFHCKYLRSRIFYVLREHYDIDYVCIQSSRLLTSVEQLTASIESAFVSSAAKIHCTASVARLANQRIRLSRSR